ncbi:hypothetical protein K4U34_10755 [Staphylococcus epidermidis]|nr:hypothetical protein [Staphylococcus epidermidis]MCG1610244.1 hypothetical protein [Staphylococcus epidermidis]
MLKLYYKFNFATEPELEQTVKHYQPQVDTFKRMLTHIDSTGYINFGSYKNDRLLLNQIRNSKRD